jgi:hypothetical protein
MEELTWLRTPYGDGLAPLSLTWIPRIDVPLPPFNYSNLGDWIFTPVGAEGMMGQIVEVGTVHLVIKRHPSGQRAKLYLNELQSLRPLVIAKFPQVSGGQVETNGIYQEPVSGMVVKYTAEGWVAINNQPVVLPVVPRLIYRGSAA